MISHQSRPLALAMQRSKDGSACSLLSYSSAFQNGFDIDNKHLLSRGFIQYYIKAGSEQREEDASEVLFKEGLCTGSATLISQLTSDTMFVLCDFSDPSHLRCLYAIE